MNEGATKNTKKQLTLGYGESGLGSVGRDSCSGTESITSAVGIGFGSASGETSVASTTGSDFKTSRSPSAGSGRPLLLAGSVGRIAFPICYKSCAKQGEAC